MKKILYLVVLMSFITNFALADEVQNLNSEQVQVKQEAKVIKNDISEYKQLLEKIGFNNAFSKKTPKNQVKDVINKMLSYSNSYDVHLLKSLYADTYVSADGFDKEVYFDLVEKTWKTYPTIKYELLIKDISVTGNNAVVQAIEACTSTALAENQAGYLYGYTTSVYYLEKRGNDWKIISDSIIDEKTMLMFGDAMFAGVELSTPQQVPSNSEYTAILKILPPKDTTIIASIGQEEIAYPQKSAEEVYRKLPEDGILERVFTSNKNNVNEYTVASIGVTKTKLLNETELNVTITGVGYIMSRVNVIPENKLIIKEGKIGEESSK